MYTYLHTNSSSTSRDREVYTISILHVQTYQLNLHLKVARGVPTDCDLHRTFRVWKPTLYYTVIEWILQYLSHQCQLVYRAILTRKILDLSFEQFTSTMVLYLFQMNRIFCFVSLPWNCSDRLELETTMSRA